MRNNGNNIGIRISARLGRSNYPSNASEAFGGGAVLYDGSTAAVRKIPPADWPAPR